MNVDFQLPNNRRQSIGLPSSSMHFISIVAPVLNEERYIGQFIDCVRNNTYPKDRLELLLIEGRSDDQTQSTIQDYLQRCPWIKLIDNTKRRIPAALNLGLQHARGTIIIRMDVHTSYPPDYIAESVNVLVRSGVQNVGGRVIPTGTNYIASCIALGTSHPFGVGDSKYRYSEKEELVDSVYPGTWWAGTLRDLGGFNESLEANEDYEMNIRLRRAGGKVLLHPAIKCRYFVRDNLIALARQYWKYGYWKIRTLRLHPDSLRWRQAGPPLLLIGLLVSAGWGFYSLRLGLILPVFYVACNLLATFAIAARHGWKYSFGLPVVFGAIHLSWGAGFLTGLLKLCLPRRSWPTRRGRPTRSSATPAANRIVTGSDATR